MKTKVPIFVTERIILSARLKGLITLLSHSAVICFQAEQGSLRSTLTTRLELCVCVCVCVCEWGYGRGGNHLSIRVREGKPPVTRIRKDLETYKRW